MGRNAQRDRNEMIFMTADNTKEALQLNSSAINVAIGIPKTVANVSPPNTMLTALGDCSDDTELAATAKPIDQKTGCKTAGKARAKSKKENEGAIAERIFEIEKAANTSNSVFFLSAFENAKVIKGAEIAIISAKILSNHPALSMVI